MISACNLGDDGLSESPPDLIEIDKSQLAFPEAEGHGAYAKGGRGGKVIYVRNLNDSGPGSFREAVTQEGARTVLLRFLAESHLRV